VPGLSLAPGLNQITVAANDPSGNATQAVLSVLYRVPPFFLEQPASLFAATNDTVTFGVAVGGDEPFKFQWRKNGASIAGATNDWLTLTNVTTAAAGSYSVLVSNPAGSRTSTNAVLKVFVPPRITVQPVSGSVTEGRAFRFSVRATGTAPLFYQWQLGDVPIPGATNTTYTIPRTATNQAGLYRVAVSNFAGVSFSTNAGLKVNVPPRLPVQPQSQFAVLGPTNLTFQAEATGTEPLRFQWRKNGGNIPGATNASYTLNFITNTSGGSFSVYVANVAGTVISSNAVLKVFLPPAFVTQPASRSVTAGGAVTFTASASGTAPLFYQWWRNDAPIPGATNASHAIIPAQTNHAGQYSVTVSNFAGTLTSSNVVLTVNVPPVFTLQPQSQAAPAGAPAIFDALVSGTEPLRFQWRKNGGNISGATNASYVIPNVTNSSAGSYSVFVQNVAGSRTSTNAVLAVLPPVPAAARQAIETPPTLTIAVDGNQVFISWPLTPGEFSLQSSTDLRDWQALPPADVVEETCRVVDTLGSPSRFYRLIRLGEAPAAQ
jgi:hypothetical protein